MKYLLLIFVILMWSLDGCQPPSDNQQFEAKTDTMATTIKSHVQGHPSDPPPPCSRCNDKIISSLYPKNKIRKPTDSLDILSFENYVFFESKVKNQKVHYMSHKSKVKDLNLTHNDKVSFTLEPHYILDCDTIKGDTGTTYIYFNTGIKLMLPDTIIKDNKGDFKYVDKSRIKGHQNQLPNASLFNAGYVKTNDTRIANGYISQDYYYLGMPADLANDTFFMHIEKMVVFKGTKLMSPDYFLDVAVDIQINTHRKHHLHALGTDGHKHL